MGAAQRRAQAKMQRRQGFEGNQNFSVATEADVSVAGRLRPMVAMRECARYGGAREACMAWGGKDDDEDLGPRPWREPLAWLGCLVAVVMPTVMLTGLFQLGGRAVAPFFTPLLFLGLFTSLVLLVRPWTFR